MNPTKKCKDAAYASKIGPNSPEEAKMIHKGVFDGADIWNPKKFAAKINEVTSKEFEEFEDGEYHYYISTFVAMYVLKWVGVVIALGYFPELLAAFQ